MATKRNNNNDKVEEFAIGTKIKYNDKLYEVAEELFCDNCSIANICANNDVYTNNKSGNVLSREQRLNIFGECSNFNRSDGTSVVFKEIPMTKSDDINHNIIQPLVESDGTIKDLQIKAPYNYEIDIENSDLSKGIIKFKRNWLTIKDVYKNLKECNIPIIYINDIKLTSNSKIEAMIILMDIARYFNADWKYNANSDECGYMIAYDKTTTEPYHYQVVHINADTDMYFGNVMFKNEADAKYAIDNPNFRSILDVIFKV